MAAWLMQPGIENLRISNGAIGQINYRLTQ
jgi:hypothetical protein